MKFKIGDKVKCTHLFSCISVGDELVVFDIKEKPEGNLPLQDGWVAFDWHRLRNGELMWFDSYGFEKIEEQEQHILLKTKEDICGSTWIPASELQEGVEYECDSYHKNFKFRLLKFPGNDFHHLEKWDQSWAPINSCCNSDWIHHIYTEAKFRKIEKEETREMFVEFCYDSRDGLYPQPVSGDEPMIAHEFFRKKLVFKKNKETNKWEVVNA